MCVGVCVSACVSCVCACACVCVCVCAHARVYAKTSLYGQDFAFYKYFNYYYFIMIKSDFKTRLMCKPFRKLQTSNVHVRRVSPFGIDLVKITTTAVYCPDIWRGHAGKVVFIGLVTDGRFGLYGSERRDELVLGSLPPRPLHTHPPSSPISRMWLLWPFSITKEEEGIEDNSV